MSQKNFWQLFDFHNEKNNGLVFLLSQTIPRGIGSWPPPPLAKQETRESIQDPESMQTLIHYPELNHFLPESND